MSSGSTPNAPPTSSPPVISRPSSSRTWVWAVLAVVVIAILGVAVAYQAGWISPKSSNGGCAPTATSVTGAGSTLVYPLMYFWSTTYHDSTVNYNSVGSGAGISAITGHTVDYGASDAPLNPAQRAAASGLMILPESAGAVVPIYNLAGVTKPLNFTGDVLARIFMGNITAWNDPAITALNPGINIPTGSIVPVHRLDGSGTTFIFSSFLATSNPIFAHLYGHATTVNWPGGELSSKGNSGVAATVQQTAFSIGYVDINYAASTSLAYGAVKNPAGNFVHANVSNSASALADAGATLPAPTADWYNFSVQNAPGATDYPIVSYTYVLLYQDPGKAFSTGGAGYTLRQAQNVVDFLWWAVHSGQQYAPQLFYIKLPSSVVTYDENELKSMTYNGAAISICTSTS